MRMKTQKSKRSLLCGVLWTTALALFLSGCGGSSKTASIAANTPANGGQTKAASQSATSVPPSTGKTFTLIAANSTCHDTQEAEMKQFLAAVTTLSKGRIKTSLRSCSSLGNIREVLDGLHNNSVQATITPAVFMTAFIPQMGVIGMPWLFPPTHSISSIVTEETTVLSKGGYGKSIRKLAEAKGFHLVSLYGLSPQEFFTRSPISDMAGFKGKKINVGAGKEQSLMLKEWGGLPVTLPISQWYTSLEQGTIDGQQAPPEVAIQTKISEVAPYVTLDNHVVMAEVIAVSKKWYTSLPKDLQQAVDAAGVHMDQVGPGEWIKTEVKAVKELQQGKSTHVNTVSAKGLAQMERVSKDGVWKIIATDPTTGPALKLLQSDIQKYGGS